MSSVLLKKTDPVLFKDQGLNREIRCFSWWGSKKILKECLQFFSSLAGKKKGPGNTAAINHQLHWSGFFGTPRKGNLAIVRGPWHARDEIGLDGRNTLIPCRFTC